MESLISGFENDIFISYCQKDNKGDRWVCEFVNALRGELALQEASRRKTNVRNRIESAIEEHFKLH